MQLYILNKLYILNSNFYFHLGAVFLIAAGWYAPGPGFVRGSIFSNFPIFLVYKKLKFWKKEIPLEDFPKLYADELAKFIFLIFNFLLFDKGLLIWYIWWI